MAYNCPSIAVPQPFHLTGKTDWFSGRSLFKVNIRDDVSVIRLFSRAILNKSGNRSLRAPRLISY